MTTTPETLPSLQDSPSPGNHLTAMCHSVLHAIELTKANQLYEAGEHVDAVDRLIVGYWTAMGEPEHGRARDIASISDRFPEGAAANRLKQALAEFRAAGQPNTLADDLEAVLKLLEFTRSDIAQLRRAWAAVTGCLMKQSRHQFLTDADLVDVPQSHRAFFQGRDAMRRELLSVVAERDALKADQKKEGRTA